MLAAVPEAAAVAVKQSGASSDTGQHLFGAAE